MCFSPLIEFPDIGLRLVIKHGAGRPGSPKEGPARAAKRPPLVDRSGARGRFLWTHRGGREVGSDQADGSVSFLLGGHFSVQGPLFSHALAGQFDAVGVVNQSVEDGISDRWIPNNFIPSIYRHLADHDSRAVLVTILDDFEQIATLSSSSFSGPQSSRMNRLVLANFFSSLAYRPSPLARASFAKSRGAR